MANAEVQTQEREFPYPTCMESVNRIVKLPVVESTVQTAGHIYEKVKDLNSATQWACSTAENVVNKAVEIGKPIAVPIVQGLEGPIKKVDDVLCSGLDYVENKVPAVKMPPGEMYNCTKGYVESVYHRVEPTVKNAYEKIEPVIQTTREAVEPSVKSAYERIEPAVEKAMNIVDPLVQPALDRAHQLREFAAYVVEDVLNNSEHTHSEGSECEECMRTASRASEREAEATLNGKTNQTESDQQQH